MSDLPDLPLDDLPHSPLVRTLKTGDRIEIRRRWWSNQVWGLLAVSVIWTGTVVLFMWGILRGQATGSLGGLGAMLLIGLGIGYYALALAINETRIYVEGGLLHVAVKPLTLRKERLYRIADIVDLRAHVIPIGNSVENNYTIQILTVDGNVHNIASNIFDGRDAVFIEQELKFILQNAPQSKLTPKGKPKS